MNKSGYWYLLTGILLGFSIGLIYAWWITPANLEESASPQSLRADFKDEYRLLIASAYLANGNLDRARARLALLGGDSLQTLAAQTQQLMNVNAPAETVRLLARLAEDLQAQPALTASAPLQPDNPPPAAASPRPSETLDDAAFAPPITQAAPSPLAPMTPTRLPLLPQATFPHLEPAPSPTLGAPFALLNQASFCEPERPAWLEIRLLNASGDPALAIPVTITWPGGEETFFTGFKPDLGGNGYADFVMTPGVEYTLQLSQNATRVTGLRASECSSAAGTYLGGIRLEFQQP